MASRRRLVDARAIAPPLLRAGAGKRQQRGGLLGAGQRPLVPPAGLMSVPYVELHCHSAYSFGDGASDPAELAAAAADLGHEALALTDHNGVYGCMEFAHACQGVGVLSIVGCELTLSLDR